MLSLAPMLNLIFPLAIELDFSKFPPVKGAPVEYKIWYRLETMDKKASSNPLPVIMVVQVGPSTMGSIFLHYCLSEEWDARMNVRDETVTVIGHGSSPVKSVEYRTTGPKPIIRWVIKPEPPPKEN